MRGRKTFDPSVVPQVPKGGGLDHTIAYQPLWEGHFPFSNPVTHFLPPPLPWGVSGVGGWTTWGGGRCDQETWLNPSYLSDCDGNQSPALNGMDRQGHPGHKVLVVGAAIFGEDGDRRSSGGARGARGTSGFIGHTEEGSALC